MRHDWIADPLFWVLALPAVIASGILIQMILSLFTCCGTFKLRGKPVLLKWWMIPGTAALCALLWLLAVLYLLA